MCEFEKEKRIFRLPSNMFCLEHQCALRSRREWGTALLPASDTPSLTDPVSNFTEFLTLFCEPISRKSHHVPKIEAVKSAQDVTSKSGTSLIPRPDQKASRLFIFWITYLDNCYLTNGSKLSQTKLSLVSCWHDLSEIIIFVIEITKQESSTNWWVLWLVTLLITYVKFG